MERNQIIEALQAAITILKSSATLDAPSSGGGAPAPARQGAREQMGAPIEAAEIPTGPVSGQIKFISFEPSKSGKDQCFLILGWRQNGESQSAKFYSWDAATITRANAFDKGDIVEINAKPWRFGVGIFDRIERKG